jgi:hypothetical protein
MRVSREPAEEIAQGLLKVMAQAVTSAFEVLTERLSKDDQSFMVRVDNS